MGDDLPDIESSAVTTSKTISAGRAQPKLAPKNKIEYYFEHSSCHANQLIVRPDFQMRTGKRTRIIKERGLRDKARRSRYDTKTHQLVSVKSSSRSASWAVLVCLVRILVDLLEVVGGVAIGHASQVTLKCHIRAILCLAPLDAAKGIPVGYACDEPPSLGL